MSASRLLALPLELRLQIYEHVLSSSSSAVTFSAARLSGSQSDVVHRLYGEGRSPLSGLPHEYIPVVEADYSESLLRSIPNPTVPARGPSTPEELSQCSYSPIPSILLTNRQIRAEVLQRFPEAMKQPINIFISYPYGLHVFDTIYPNLLTRARTVQISGEYVTRGFDAARAIAVVSPVESQHSGTTSKQSFTPSETAEQLGRLVSAILGLNLQPVELHMRVHFPGPNSYNTVWGDNVSPIVIALQSICAGEIQLEVWRGSSATAVYLAARPSKNGKRTVRTIWRHFEDAQHASKTLQDWEIDPRWPMVEWNETLEADTIVSSTPYSETSHG